MEVPHAYRLLPGVRNERGGWDDDRSVGAEPQPYRRFLSVRYRTPYYFPVKIQDSAITGFVQGTVYRFALEGDVATDGSFAMGFHGNSTGVFRGTLSADSGQGEYTWVSNSSGASCPGTFTMRRKP